MRPDAASPSRRQFLHLSGASLLFAGAARSGVRAWSQAAQQPPPKPLSPTEQVEARRAQMGAAPIQQTPLGPNLVMLSGPGGNVVVLHGADGKVIVDSFVQPAWTKLKGVLDGFGAGPIALLIDTHWHFDHTDNNANLHAAGAKILAHANTKTRLGESHDLLGMHFEPSPAEALPTQTFTRTWTQKFNGEELALEAFAPAHTDTDISVRYPKANVLHMGDVFFNGTYPFFDASTGGNISGMVAGATIGLGMADGRTKIVPGHGPLGDKAALTKYRDMLATIRDRVQKMKTAGRSLEEVQKAAPSAEFDADWGKGMFGPNDFIALVYSSL
jgi:cyclase